MAGRPLILTEGVGSDMMGQDQETKRAIDLLRKCFW